MMGSVLIGGGKGAGEEIFLTQSLKNYVASSSDKDSKNLNNYLNDKKGKYEVYLAHFDNNNNSYQLAVYDEKNNYKYYQVSCDENLQVSGVSKLDNASQLDPKGQEFNDRIRKDKGLESKQQPKLSDNKENIQENIQENKGPRLR